MSFFCRPILLCSEFIPVQCGERTWQYQAFGHYDGVKIEEPFPIPGNGSFQDLFEASVRYEDEINSYSAQVLFGFYEDYEKECDFWQADLPVLYLTLLQFKGDSVTEYKKNLSKDEDDIKIQTYYSLDNSELVLAIKCRQPSLGAKELNDLHRGECAGCKIRNSYSILGICKDLENTSFLSEKIEMAELRFIEWESGSVRKLYAKMEEELGDDESISLKRELIFGTEDESIVIEDIPWSRFLPFFKKGTGALCNSNESARKYVVSAKIMFSLRESDGESCGNADDTGMETERGIGGEINFCDKLAGQIKEIYKARQAAVHKGEQKTLTMIVNALRRFEKTKNLENHFTDYNIYTIFLPFSMFLKLQKQDERRHMEHYYKFIKSMRMRTQNFAKPDRLFSQSADFNMRYFDTPAKFVTVYSAYLYYMKRALNNDRNKNYEFLICPGENVRMTVKELFPRTSDTDRLFLVEMPENQTYELKQMFITLAHETAHFVGTGIRQREARKKILIDICARITILAIQESAYYSGAVDVSQRMREEWKYLKDNLAGWIGEYVKANTEEDNNVRYKGSELEQNAEFISKYGAHTEILKKVLVQVMRDILLDRGKQIFGFVLAGEYEAEQEKEEITYASFFEEREEELQEHLKDLVALKQIRVGALTVEAALDEVIYLMKECYADVICILTLQLSMEDYFMSFLEELEAAGKRVEDIKDTIIIARAAIVCTVLHYSQGALAKWKDRFEWKQDDIAPDDTENKKLRELEKLALEFRAEYMVNGEPVRMEKRMIDAIHVIYDKEILKNITKYLLKCRCEFEKEKQKQNDKLRRVRQFFELSQTDGAGQFFGAMTELLVMYEKDVWLEIAARGSEQERKTEECCYGCGTYKEK